jgi:hypothetical protein
MKPFVGKRIEIRDPDGIWSSAAISAVRKKDLEIRYDGWDVSWNEVLPVDHPRLASIYTHTSRLKCLVDLIPKPKSRGKKSGNANMMTCWPCILHTRMPDDGLPTAAALLKIEKKVFIQPYRPGLLPKYLREDLRNGGIWWDVARVKKWEHMDESGNNKFHPNFKFAYETCLEDKSVPGYLKEYIFVEGSCVSETYLVKVGSKENSLIQLDGWEEDTVDLKALDARVEAEDANKEKSHSGLSDQNKTAKTVSSEGSESKEKKMSSDSSKEPSTKRKRMNKNDNDESFVVLDSSDDEAILERNSRKRQSTSSTKLASPSFYGNLPSPVQGIEILYPGYDIQYSESTASWIASFDVFGNKVFVGQYPDQTQAKIAIDMARMRLMAANQVQHPMGMQQQQQMFPPQMQFQANIQANVDDINNFGLDQAVSLAYRNGALSGNGFSMHNWAMRNIRNTAYDPRYQQNFLDMTRRQLMGRQQVLGTLNQGQNFTGNGNRVEQARTPSQPIDQNNSDPQKEIGKAFRI